MGGRRASPPLLTQWAALDGKCGPFTGSLPPGPPSVLQHTAPSVLNRQLCKSDDSTHVHKPCGSSPNTGSGQQPSVQCPSMQDVGPAPQPRLPPRPIPHAVSQAPCCLTAPGGLRCLPCQQCPLPRASPFHSSAPILPTPALEETGHPPLCYHLA